MNIVILAAGKGTRMKSDMPKVLAKLSGKSLIEHILEIVIQISSANIVVVVGYQKEKVIEAIQKFPVQTVVQAEQLGTGHAVKQAIPVLDLNQHETLVLCGDVPLISLETLNTLSAVQQETQAKATVLTTKLKDPASYGRIVRGKHHEVLKIVEYKDASETERAINEINSGTYIFDTNLLLEALEQLQSNNAQKEFYLTDTLEILRKQHHRVSAFCTEKSEEVLGINTEEDLRHLENAYVIKHSAQ